jgi:kynurenine formamidase
MHRPHLLPLALLIATACTAPAPEESLRRGSTPEAGQAKSVALDALESARLVDLTYPYDENTLYWPTSPSRFKLDELAYGPTEGGYFYSSYSLSTPEHGGTHLDAPIHFAEGRHTVDQIPLETLLGPAAVIDVSEQASQDPDYRLTAADVTAWEAVHGTVPKGAIVLLRTGWGRFWPQAKAYLGDDTPGDASNLHFPSYGEDSARLLVEERKVAVLGVDTASIDHGPSKDFIVHQVANGANVPGLENVAHLDQLPATGAWVLALPMKIGGGSGGPVRIVALLP